MAALWVTIDNLDGTTTVKGPVYPDEIDTHGMLFKLSEAKIAGITFTRANPLEEKAYKLDPECWRSYSGRGKAFKRAMETRRIASLDRAAKTLEWLTCNPGYDNPRTPQWDYSYAAPRHAHSFGHHCDYVTQGVGDRINVWMVPGTYDAEADLPPLPPPGPTIHTMLGHPFDVNNWRIKLDDQFYSAGELREIAGVMDDVRARR